MKSLHEGIKGPWKIVTVGLVGVIGYLGVGRAVDSLPFRHLPHVPKPAETKTTTQEGLATVIARELEKTQRFQGDKKTYLITTDMEKRKALYLFGVHVGDDVNKGVVSTTGSARGVVEFSGISESAGITVAPDNSSVTIHLPHAHVEDVVASHEKGVVHTFYDPNLACQADQKIGKCPDITDVELLQLADKKLTDTVANDAEIVPSAEEQARLFLDGLINGVGVPLLHNQDPLHAPTHINVQVAFDNAANAISSSQANLQGRG